MTTSEAYARLLRLRLPIMTTGDVAAALRSTKPAATMLLRRLAAAGLARRVRTGIWSIGTGTLDRYSIVDALTAPMPSYISLQTALYLHGMIEQVPAVIYVVSLAPTQRITTTIGTYSVHHIAAELFDGFVERTNGTKLASLEKALFDMAYFSSARSRLFAHLPEIELPEKLRDSKLRTWISRISSPRRRSMVQKRLDEMRMRSQTQ